MYNILEKVRSDEVLTERERVTHEQGLISLLRQIHDDLDAAIFEAYGWPNTLTDEEVIERLVRLNVERVKEERAGIVHWLRPEYQRPAAGIAAGFGEGFEAAAPAKAKEKKQEWPKTLPSRRAPFGRCSPLNPVSLRLNRSPRSLCGRASSG
jgi:hypothetical protein